MPRRISRLGGTTLRRSFITNAYSPAIFEMGAPKWPPYPPFLRGAPAEPWRPSIYPINLSDQPPMFGHHAAVLDDANAGAGQRLGAGVVADAELEPDRGRPPRQRHDLGGVRRQVF